MCGFTGIVYSDSSRTIDPDTYTRLTEILSHRGPDNLGCFRDDRIDLIHHRLSIIDPTDQANQPMKDPNTGNVVVFNGEIYNYKELKSQHNDIHWHTNSDTEVILKLYQRLGKSFVNKLNGIFAFAIYDNVQKCVLLYRDRFGIKPLHYINTQSGFAFSSEIKPLLQLIRPEYDRTVIFDYLEYGRLAHDQRTFFRGVCSLKPAHYMKYDFEKGSISTVRYWDIKDDNSLSNLSNEQIVERTYTELQKAIRLNMVSDVEVAVSLSSGADSTLILRLAQQQTAQIKAFTFGFEEDAYDEVSRIKDQDSLKGIELHPVYLRPGQMLELLKQAVYYFETPLGGLGTLSAYNMMKEVRRKGIKVMLAGEGADEIFGGYQYYFPAYFKDLEYDNELLYREVEDYAKAHGIKMKPFCQAYNELIKTVNSKTVLAPDGTGSSNSHASSDLRAEFKQDALVSGPAIFKSCLICEMYRDLTEKKLPKLLHFQDRAGMAGGIETRVPYLDHNLVEFIYALGNRCKIYRGQSKYLLKAVLKRYFDYTEPKKTKHYVATPQREWLKTTSLAKEILETLRFGWLVEEGLIDFKLFERDYNAYISQPELGNSFFVWKLINLEYLLGQKWN